MVKCGEQKNSPVSLLIVNSRTAWLQSGRSHTFKLGVVGILDREQHRRNEVDRVRWEEMRRRILATLKRPCGS
jgi:hypothetical protein